MLVSYAGNAGVIGCKTMFGVEANCVAVPEFGLQPPSYLRTLQFHDDH